MRKIPTLFKRTEDRRYVVNEVTPGCEWVLMGQGTATRKYDGTCIRIDDGGCVFVRHEVKPGKAEPDGFASIGHDDVTGKTVGWMPYEQSGFAKFIQEAVEHTNGSLEPGTYELCGPKINGNSEGFPIHVLVCHSTAERLAVPLTFSGLRDWLQRSEFEGIVWHHPDGRMAKLKKRDFPAAP